MEGMKALKCVFRCKYQEINCEIKRVKMLGITDRTSDCRNTETGNEFQGEF
jgi:hypothetical protein